MNQEQGFFHDILERPDDDAPRLIYADWLEDQVETDRAELIRVQCALARLLSNSPDYSRLRDRSWELEKKCR